MRRWLTPSVAVTRADWRDFAGFPFSDGGGDRARVSGLHEER